jgi:hypothetical protein
MMSEADFERDGDDVLASESEYEYFSEEEPAALAAVDVETGDEFGSDEEEFFGGGGYVPTVAKVKKQPSATMPKKTKKKKKKARSPERALKRLAGGK